jgi:hypothetical protein
LNECYEAESALGSWCLKEKYDGVEERAVWTQFVKRFVNDLTDCCDCRFEGLQFGLRAAFAAEYPQSAHRRQLLCN